MITLILCLRPLRIPKYIWFKILRDRRYEFGPELCRGDDPLDIFVGASRLNNFKLAKYCITDLGVDGSDVTTFKNACFYGEISYIKEALPFINKETEAKGLVAACAGNRPEVLPLLDVSDPCGRGLSYACRGGYLKIIEAFTKHGINTVWDLALPHACMGGHIDSVKFIIKLGCSISTLSIFQSIYHGQLDILKYLLKKTKKTFAESHSEMNESPSKFFNFTLDEALHKACYGDQLEMVEYFVELGAKDFNSILSSMKSVEIKKYLIRRGADPNLCLESACEMKQTEFVEFLIENGVNDFLAIKKLALKTNNKDLLKILSN